MTTSPTGSGVSIEAIPSGIAVTGDVDASTASALAAALDDATEIADLVVDLDGVGFMDSSGLRALLADQQRRRQLGQTITVTRPTTAVQRLLDIAGVAALLGAAGDAPPRPVH